MGVNFYLSISILSTFYFSEVGDWIPRLEVLVLFVLRKFNILYDLVLFLSSSALGLIYALLGDADILSMLCSFFCFFLFISILLFLNYSALSIFILNCKFDTVWIIRIYYFSCFFEFFEAFSRSSY